MSDDLQVIQESQPTNPVISAHLSLASSVYYEGCLQGSLNLLKGVLILAASLRLTIFLPCIYHENNSSKNL